MAPRWFAGIVRRTYPPTKKGGPILVRCGSSRANLKPRDKRGGRVKPPRSRREEPFLPARRAL
eukprot:2912235-Amphidinium_carterae.1